MKLLTRLFLLLPAALFAACATATPQGRMAAYPQLVQSIPQDQQALVQQGVIREGMSRDAVFIALGRPNRVLRGSENGRETEIWRYTELTPVYGTAVGFGGGWGPWGGWCGPGWGWGPGVAMGPDFLPVTAAVIRFVNGRVVSWERVQ